MMIFFDIDDTLIDQRRAELAAAAEFLHVYAALLPHHYTVRELCRTWRQLRAKHLPAFLRGDIPYEEYHRRRIRDLFAVERDELPDSEADRRFAAFLEPYRRAWRPFDDVNAALDKLHAFRLGVVSNGHSELQRSKLTRTGLTPRFQTIVISEEVGAAKPDPSIFRHACHAVDCAPRDCAYVGDGLRAVVGAARAGLLGIWINRNGHTAAGNIATVRTLLQLPALVGAATARVSAAIRHNGY